MPQGMDIRLLAVSVERQAQADLKERWNGRIFNYLGDTVYDSPAYAAGGYL